MNSRIIIDSDLKTDQKLYRYLTLSQFMTFVEQRKVYLTKIKSWEDTWEVPHSHLPVQNSDGTLREVRGNFFDLLLGQCWSKNGDSVALWRIYSPDKQGIQIETSVKKFHLMQYVKGMLAPIIYYPDSDLLWGLQQIDFKKYEYVHLAHGLLKRVAFNHEDEVRFITMNDVAFLKNYNPNNNVVNIDLDPFEFIENIVIDPRASEWYEETIQKYCMRIGFKILPIRSELYSPHVFLKNQIAMRWEKDE